jgi:hypothetical protein
LFSLCLPVFGQPRHEYFTVEENVLIKYTGSEQSVIIPDTLGIKAIGTRAFALSNIVSVTLPAGVETIEDWAFWGCTNLQDITLPEGLTRIGDWAFLGCTNLRRVLLPDSLAQIGDWTFGNCPSLTGIEAGEKNPVFTALDGVLFDKTGEILTAYPGGKPEPEYTVPAEVTLIRNLAFSGAVNLVTVRLSANIGYIGNLAFYGCTSLTALEVDPENPAYRSIGGVLFDKAGTTLLAYPGGNKNPVCVIPEGTEAIGDRAFYGCTAFNSVSIPASVVRIGQEAFQGCTALESLALPKTVTDIGDRAFYGCSALHSIQLFRETSLGEEVFGSVPAQPAYTDS